MVLKLSLLMMVTMPLVCQALCPPGRHACIPAHETAGQWEWVLAPKMSVPLPAERDGVRLAQRAQDHQRLQAAHSLRLTRASLVTFKYLCTRVSQL